MPMRGCFAGRSTVRNTGLKESLHARRQGADIHACALWHLSGGTRRRHDLDGCKHLLATALLSRHCLMSGCISASHGG
eukprot:4557528-Pleurochrysis_carterae.AAC.3